MRRTRELRVKRVDTSPVLTRFPADALPIRSAVNLHPKAPGPVPLTFMLPPADRAVCHPPHKRRVMGQTVPATATQAASFVDHFLVL